MSITNRHPNIQKIINPDMKLGPNDRHWILIFLKLKFNDTDLNIENYFYELNIKLINREINIEQIYIYTYSHPENERRFDFLIKNFKPKMVDITTVPQSNSLKLFIINTFMNHNKNIILLEDGYGFSDQHKNELSLINSTDSIFSNFIRTDKIAKINGAYLGISEKFNLNHIISANILIVPFNDINFEFFGNSLKMANQLMYDDMDLMTNISLTVTNFRSKNKIKNINNLIICNYTIYDNKNIHFLIEKYISEKNLKIEKRHLITYDDPKYVYYPCFDVDHSLYLDNINPEIANTDEKIINTNGYCPIIPKQHSIYPLMYKRFDSKTSGIFIKKTNAKIIIPKILHHIWLESSPITNYTNAWGRILRDPWKYMIWTEIKLRNDVLKNDWLTIYENENNFSIKLLVVCLAVLEKYGGIVIDSFVLPIKLFPDEFLSHKFLISFLDERTAGTKLCYRIMASVPGSIDPKKRMKINDDAARRPFEGINNFFINIKLKEKENLQLNAASDQPINNVEIFNKFSKILLQERNISLIENAILSDRNIMIYPSYFFNPNCYTYPKKLSDLAVCINLWKLEINEKRTKTDLKRTYKVTEKGILASLDEDPKDRLKNNNKINF